QLGRRRALLRSRVQLEQLGRVERALVERIAQLDRVTATDEQPRSARQLVLTGLERLAVLVHALGHDRHLRPALRLLDVDLPGDFGQPSGTLRVTCLEDLDDARKAVRDVGTSDAARVERAHGQLRAGLADRLRGDDANGVADL